MYVTLDKIFNINNYIELVSIDFKMLIGNRK